MAEIENREAVKVSDHLVATSELSRIAGRLEGMATGFEYYHSGDTDEWIKAMHEEAGVLLAVADFIRRKAEEGERG